jgi:hypothetical protein
MSQGRPTHCIGNRCLRRVGPKSVSPQLCTVATLTLKYKTQSTSQTDSSGKRDGEREAGREAMHAALSYIFNRCHLTGSSRLPCPSLSKLTPSPQPSRPIVVFFLPLDSPILRPLPLFCARVISSFWCDAAVKFGQWWLPKASS